MVVGRRRLEQIYKAAEIVLVLRVRTPNVLGRVPCLPSLVVQLKAFRRYLKNAATTQGVRYQGILQLLH